ncbi:MAG: methyltransferase domain-containing protein [Methylocystis sp.]|uniref:class I SAM-dependent methyltransferase n=1 Tax=Methylocystis sp. TaxID=1911079 RepID=UPI00395363FD
MSRHGFLDVCLQSHVAGWAMEDGGPAVLDIFINDERIAQIDCNYPRPELAQFNILPSAGFFFHFPSPLSPTDVASVRFRSGEHIENSPSRQHVRHLDQMLHGVAGGRGLEFGALDRPMLSRERFDVFFVDHASREDLVKKYQAAHDVSLVNPERIVHVDFVWPGGALDAVVGGQRFSFALASGVIEHIGDPIGWLTQIASVLEPGGRLNLAIPEPTMTFDHRRRLTSPAEMLDDHLRGLQRPNFRQIFDHVTGVAPLGAPAPDRETRLDNIRRAYGIGQAAERDGQYLDMHCHVWTPQSWLECWETIEALNLAPLRIDHMFEPLPETAMFVVSLVRT